MAKLLDIITDPDPLLRKRSEAIGEDKIKTEEFQALCADMALTMQKKDGVGLAAPQIARNIRMIVVATKDGPQCMINPVLTNKSWAKEWGEEGCLSVPDVFGQVKRHKKTRCEYLDIKGGRRNVEAAGLLARILQHEIDHLDGVLFIDKARRIKSLDERKNSA